MEPTPFPFSALTVDSLLNLTTTLLASQLPASSVATVSNISDMSGSAAESAALASTTMSHSADFIEPPEDLTWCFDLIVFYKSIAEEDQQAMKVLQQLETYSKFSFAVNGLLTCLLATFGLVGNVLLQLQLRKSRYFSRRLASHLSMLCLWDMALLLCCLVAYGVLASYYGILPFVGLVAYLLYFFQPFASFCVTGTIWQVLAITIERFMAVSKPLEQRTRNAQFSSKTIFCCIALGAFLLNMVVVPFERRLKDCYEFTQNGFQVRTMIVQDDLVNNQLYAILAHLIPDIIFRAPTPIVLIAFLTVRTLQICSRRTVGSQTIQHASRVPYLLTLLNAKFILCNTLYVFNTFLLEVLGYGGKTSAQQSELEMTQYIRSLYLTDFSNLGLAVHSATNWLIFYHWPRLRSRRQKKISNLTMTSNATSKATVLDVENVEELLQRFIPIKYTAATNILTSLCAHSNHLAKALIGSEMQNGHDNDAKNGFLEREDFAKNTIIQKHAIILGDTLENILRSLVSKSSITEWRDVCRSLGYRYHKINLHCSAEHWKMIRVILVQSIGHNSGSRWQNAKVHQSSMTNVQRTMAKVFNYSLREMKSGALCAMVDRAHKQVRLQRSAGDLNESKLFMHCDSLNDREAHERSLSPKRHNSDISRRRNSEVKRVLLRSCESLSLIIPRAESMDATSTVTDATTTVTDSRRSTDVIVETRLTSNGTLSNGKTITKPNWEMKSCITSENGHVLSDI